VSRACGLARASSSIKASWFASSFSERRPLRSRRSCSRRKLSSEFLSLICASIAMAASIASAARPSAIQARNSSISSGFRRSVLVLPSIFAVHW